MPYDRGQWRYSGTGGHTNSGHDFPGIEGPNLPRTKIQGGGSSSSYLDRCPLCGKKQPSPRLTCISCSYDFKKRKDDLESFIANVRNQKCNIPVNIIQQLSKNRYFNAPYKVNNFSSLVNKFENLVNSKSRDNKILVVSKNEKVISYLKKTFSKNKDNLILKFTDGGENNSSSLLESISKFQEILNSSEFSLKKFVNMESSVNISDLRYLTGNVRHINNKDVKVLNEFIKVYWKFWESSQSNEIDLELEDKNLENEISNQTKKIINIKGSISWFNKRIEKLTELYELLGINCEDVLDKLELMESILILKYSPYKLDFNKKEEFINQLEHYQQENSFGKPVSILIEKFNYDDVLQVAAAYEKYCDDDNINHINQNILSLKNQFQSYGFTFNELNSYYNIRDDISDFSSSVYLENNDLLLVGKLEEYIKNYDDSFKDVINNDKNKLLENLLLYNKYDIEDIQELNKNLININLLLSQMGINSNIISEIKELESFCNYNFDYENSYKMLPLFENIYSKLGRTITINGYVKNLQNELIEIVFNLLSNLDYDSNKSFELEYIHYNYSIIQQIIKKMGISVGNISDLNNEFENISKLSKYSFKSISLNDLNDGKKLFTESTLNYIKNNDENQILYDLNMLNISIQSIIYEYTINEKYLYLDDLSNNFNVSSHNIDLESLDLINNIKSFFNRDDFEYLMDNYTEMFGNIYNLIENCNLTDYTSQLKEFNKRFDEIYDIYDLCPNDYIDDLLNDSENYLLKLKESYSNYTRLKEFKEQGILTEITINLIKNHQFINYFEELSQIISSITHLLSRNNFDNINLDEILNKTNEILSEDMKLKNECIDLSSRIKNINSANFYETLLDIKQYSIFKENSYFNIALSDYELINEILNLYSNLKIDYCENLIDLSYDELKTFLEFIKISNKFTSYVDQGIIDKDQYIDFSNEIADIDLKIKHIKKQLDVLNLSHDILENFSQIQIKNTRKIKKVLSKIDDNLKINLDNVDESFKKIKLIVNESYSLCNNYPIELKYDNYSFNSNEYGTTLLKLKDTLKKYEKVLKIENNILGFNDIINKNLLNIWEGFFTDLNDIKEKFKIDEEFTEVYNKGIYTNKTIANLNLLSDDDLDFIKDFMEILSDNQFKSNCILIHNNQNTLISEINNLENYDKTNLIGYKKSFENLNIIFRNSEIEDCIHLLDYYIKKEDDEIINLYQDDLNQYLLIYNKYFDKTEFDLSMEEILNKLNSDIKYTDLINKNIINESYLKKIKSEKTNFLNEVEQLETLKDEIFTKITFLSETYVGYESSNSNNDFFIIEKFKNNLEKVNIYLSDDDYMKHNFKDYVSYFDYVICDYDILSDDLKYYLFLTSKKRLSIVKSEGL